MYVEKLLRELRRLDRPRFRAAHRVTGFRGSDGATAWDEADMVWGHGRHLIKRGRVETIREVPEAYAADLMAIDEERAKLNRRLAELRRDEAAVLELAYHASQPIKVTDIQDKVTS